MMNLIFMFTSYVQVMIDIIGLIHHIMYIKIYFNITNK